MISQLALVLLVQAAVPLAIPPPAPAGTSGRLASGPPPTRPRPQTGPKPPATPPPPAAPPPAATPRPPEPPPGPLPTHATACRPASAQRCGPDGCEAAHEGLHAEHFELDATAGTVGGCLYTDCYTGAARIVREAAAPWLVTGFGEVHSERPPGGVPPPGSAPFPLTVSVDLRTGRFTAIWSLSPAGLQVDFGTCELRGPE